MKVPALQFRREDLPDLSTGERTDKLLRGLNAFGADAEKALNGGLTFKANFRAFVKEITITAQDEWSTLALTGLWTVGTPGPQVSKQGHAVALRGNVLRNAAIEASTILTLPEDFRPEQDLRVAVATDGSGAVASLDIGTDGVVHAHWGASPPVTVYLDGVVFHSPNDNGQFNPVFPIRIKNELAPANPSLVFLAGATDIADGRSEPHSLGSPAWSISGDQIVLHGIGNVFHGHKYRATILVVAE